MTKFGKTLFYMIAALAVSFNTSCKKDDTLQYNNATMGNIVDGRFVSDQGNIFNIVDQQCSGQLDTMKRALVVCDVLNKTAGGAENEYDVRLNRIATVLTKNIVPNEAISDEMLVQDPIHIEHGWIAGGYINLYIIFPITVNSNTKHLINLVHEGSMKNQETGEDIEGTYHFTLRHNSFEDKVTYPLDKEYVLAGGYVSFPMNGYITESKAAFSIECIEGSESTGEGDSKPITQTLRGEYTTDGYQHSPQTMSKRAAAMIK